MDYQKYPNLNHIFSMHDATPKKMNQLVLVRHGETLWNEPERFTGWVDVDLSHEGERQAILVGNNLKHAGFSFNIAFTSVLTRAVRTTWLILEAMNEVWVPVCKSWHLNDRHYGQLQGHKISDMNGKYGETRVSAWRRDYESRPPARNPRGARHSAYDEQYGKLSGRSVPLAESLKDAYGRILPYWLNSIVPALMTYKKVLVVAHESSLKALVKHLDGISDKAIEQLEIPIAQPLVYHIDSNQRPINHFYIESKQRVEQINVGEYAVNEKINAENTL